MENILLALGILNLILLAFTLWVLLSGRGRELLEVKISQLMMRSQQDVSVQLHDFSDRLRSGQRDEFEGLRSVVEGRLDKISNRVEQNLNEGFEKSYQTFSSVLERLAKIDEAQKKIEGLSHNVVGLQDILTDKKTRGIFGEVQLNQILASVFGEKNDKIYELQKTLSNGKIVDCLLKLPGAVGLVPVDSKFPLENFKRMTNQKLSEEERQGASKDFKLNLKKHIDDIAHKYVSVPETSNQAILFLPAEAVFAEIHAYHPDIVDYASARRIWLTSPTTFLATLTTVQMVLMDMERSQYMDIMHEEINKLGQEFERYQSRWSDLAKHIGTVSKDVEKINITSHKISGQFKRIMDVDMERPS